MCLEVVVGDVSETPARESPSKWGTTAVAALAGAVLAGVLYAAGVEVWWLGLLLAGGVLRLAAGVAGRRTSSGRVSPAGTVAADVDTDVQAGPAVERLRTRYVEGDVSERELERRLERLLDPEPPATDDERATETATER